MSISRREFLIDSAAAAAAIVLTDSGATASRAAVPTSTTFEPTWDSLSQYECPEWFRDAKFGIWAHWSAQCVPEQGDWYARNMYLQGDGDYNYQIAHYGHPSKVGFKDIDYIWHAENWDPDKLIDLYVKAGAKYFVGLANHCDNFDTWNSKYQPWNSVNIGPKKDIIGVWAQAARKRGLRFGVSVHGYYCWDWFDVSHEADKTGPLAGVPYDGCLTAADGKGMWWEGYDPAELYGPAGAARTPEAHTAYDIKFRNRVNDLVELHQPDLLYFDSWDPPSAYGLEIVANYYNKNIGWNNGRLDGVVNVKDNARDDVKKSLVVDYERGRSDEIAEQPWQTDTCIGQWHYDLGVFQSHSYKTLEQVVKMLVDIVSKNGNLLLNIPVKGDGTIDSDELAFLHGMAAWMSTNSEAIYSTRSWKISGEGSPQLRGGLFSEGGEQKLGPYDFRFTTKRNVLYATALGWPDDQKLTIRTLAATAHGIVGTVKKVSLLGSKRKIAWTRTADGLVVTLPDTKPCDHAYVLKIEGLDLAASTPVTPAVLVNPPINANRHGEITLLAAAADLVGKLQYFAGIPPFIGAWENAADTVSWNVYFDHAGAYSVTTFASSGGGSTAIILDGGPGVSVVQTVQTKGFDDYQPFTGVLNIPAAEDLVLTVRASEPSSWHAMNLASIVLTPETSS